MSRKSKCSCLCVFVLVFFLISFVEAAQKSSLTFAIDDTMSMTDDIDAVKLSANEIFDTVLNSNASHIEDFVLVTINDPDVTHITTTKDRDVFRNAINSLYVHNHDNNDCEEMSMSGIELALQKSRPGSLLYVFTDASAKDPEKHESVKNLAQQKSIQVVFVLTGDCLGYGNKRVYDEVAQETSGQVFNIYKSETIVILDYVKSQINSRKEVLNKAQFPAGTHQLSFEVDSKMKELIITLSGKNPTLTITDPDGAKAPTKTNRTTNFAIVKVTEVKPGKYTADITSDSKNSVLVTAETTVHFEHGFSTFIPSSIRDTVTRPLPDKESYISVKLDTGDNDNAVLDTVQIIDLDNNILEERPLSLSADKELYISKTTITPPSGTSPKLFRVAIKGHDTKTNEEFTRISLTPIEIQKLDTMGTNKGPDVVVDGDTKINAEYNETLVLKCKINGYPKPNIIWQTNDGTILDSTWSLVEHPYDYLSTLSINQVITNENYTCIAKNDYGEASQRIQVETVRKLYFNIIKKPKGANIEIYRDSRFECEVDAYPPAVIEWYKNRKPIKEDDNVKISPDRSLLLLKNMQPYMEGTYLCTARNGIENRQFPFNVKITGTESPEINKTIDVYRVLDGSDVEIQCHIIKGNPKPTIVWFFDDANGAETEMEGSKDEETILFTNVTRDSTVLGSYRCEASNAVGSDFHRTELIIEYPPQIKDNDDISVKETNVGKKQDMDCVVDGEPKPTVKWLLNGTELALTSRHGRAYNSHGFHFYVTDSDTGIYTCQATNKYGTVNKTIDLRIYKPATIQIPENTAYKVMVGDRLELSCEADGYPEPNLKWVFYSATSKTPWFLSSSVGTIRNVSIPRVQIKDEGAYVCIAKNKGGSFNIAYEVELLAPPTIIRNPKRTFTAVLGDLVLRIPCKATGRPTPQITWIKDDVENIAAGTEFYDIDGDGTLVIKEVDKQAAGIYRCEARNIVGNASEFYQVIVEGYPTPDTPTRTELVAQGKSKAINCNLSRIRTDRFRWFKDGTEISLTRQHHIIGAKLSDAGVYTCRVSNFASSRSESIQVVVGQKPEFVYVDKGDIEYVEGEDAVMDCSAQGYPPPEISWQHGDDQLLWVTGMTYQFRMDYYTRGIYHCTLKNGFGEISRTFVVT